MPIRAVIFDRDGVLTDFDLAAAKAYLEPLLPISLVELDVFWGKWGAIYGFPRSLAEEKKFWFDFWNSLSADLHLTDTVRAQLLLFNYTSIIRPFPDARPALLRAKELGWQVGVLSNFSLASLDESLHAAGLLDLVDVTGAAMVIGFAKPAKEAYLYMLDRLAVLPTECLFFDDEFENVRGALDFGLNAFLIDRYKNPALLHPAVLSDLSQIERFANSWL